MKQKIGFDPNIPLSDAYAPLRVGFRRERRKPAGIDGRLVFDGHSLARQEISHECLGRLGIAKSPAPRRFVQRQAEPRIARRGDGSHAAQHCRDPLGECIGAAMAAQQGHGHAAVLGHGDHRRFPALVGQKRRQGADEHARRADSDHGPAGGEEQPKMGDRVGERNRAAGNPRREAMQLAINGCRDALACIERRRSQYDHCRTHHPAARTRIMEK